MFILPDTLVVVATLVVVVTLSVVLQTSDSIICRVCVSINQNQILYLKIHLTRETREAAASTTVTEGHSRWTVETTVGVRLSLSEEISLRHFTDAEKVGNVKIYHLLFDLYIF